MATKNTRWKCPNCGDGILAPTRPRLDDVRRYCLPCSSETGKLVSRFSPAMEKARAEAKDKRKAKKARTRATQARHREVKKHKDTKVKEVRTTGREGFNIQREGEKIWKLLTPYHNGKKMPQINVQQKGIKVVGDRVEMRRGKYAGLAYIGQDKIWVEAFCSWETLAHELVHMAVGVRQGVHNRKAHDKVFYDCLRDVTQRRFKVRISFFEVTRYGYNVDWLIQKQLNVTNYADTWKKKAKAM